MSRCHDVTVSPSDCNSRMASPILTFQTKSKQNAETLCPMERFSYLCNEFDTDMMTLTIKATDMIILTKNTTQMMLRWLAGILGLMQPLLQAGVSLLHGLVVNGVGQRLGGAHEDAEATVSVPAVRQEVSSRLNQSIRSTKPLPRCRCMEACLAVESLTCCQQLYKEGCRQVD